MLQIVKYSVYMYGNVTSRSLLWININDLEWAILLISRKNLEGQLKYRICTRNVFTWPTHGCKYTKEDPLYIMWMRAKRNRKLEDRNDHPWIKETCFHVARELAKRSPCCREGKGSRSEYVTRGARRWAMRRRSPLRPQTRTLPWALHHAGRMMHFLARLNLKGPPARGFRPKCFNYSRHKSVGNVKSAEHRLKNKKWRSYASRHRRRLRARKT